MRNLKRTLISFICLLLCFTMFMPSLLMADSSYQAVYDYASLLTGDEVTSLESRISEIQANYGMDAYILTTNDTEGKSAMEYADDFFYDLGYGRADTNGILLLVDMGNRKIWISTSGSAISYFTDARIQLVIDEIKGYLSSGDYYQAGETFLSTVEAVVSEPIPETNEEETSLPSSYYDETASAPPITYYLSVGGIAALIALVVSMITYFCICRSYTHPKFTQPVTAPDRSSVNYTDRQDMFIGTHTSRVLIRHDDDNSGSGSSTHSSSDGGTFGGGGGDF